MFTRLDEVMEQVGVIPKTIIAVAQAADPDMMEVAALARQRGLAEFIFLGDAKKIEETARTAKFNLEGVEVLHCGSQAECAARSMELVRTGRASMPMKGLLPTATFFRAALDRERGIRTANQISQITIVDHPTREGLCLITDCAVNVAPNLEGKKVLIENAVAVAHSLGVSCPKVGVITALELVNPAMQETIEAAALSKMSDRGQIKGCLVDGPFALDNAVSRESAQHKGITGPVAGDCDILLMNDLRVGNVLHKAITYFAKQAVASVIVGTSVPVIANSRSDSVQDKLLSIAYSVYLSRVGWG